MKKTVLWFIALLMALLLCAAASAETVEIYQDLQSYPYDLTLPDVFSYTYDGVQDAEGRYIGTVTVNTGNTGVDFVDGNYIKPEEIGKFGTVVRADNLGNGVFRIRVPDGYVLWRFNFSYVEKNHARTSILWGENGLFRSDAAINIREPGGLNIWFTFSLNRAAGIIGENVLFSTSVDDDQARATYINGKLDRYGYGTAINDDYMNVEFDKNGNLDLIELTIDGLGTYDYHPSTKQWTQEDDSFTDIPVEDPGKYDMSKIIRYLEARAGRFQIRPTDIPRDFLKNGLVNENGQWVLYKDGAVDTGAYGIMEYNGGRFFVANGAIIPNSGLVSDGSAWYYLSSGQVADYTGLASYDGAWFYVTNGMLDTERNGIVSYDGAQFMLAAGRIVTEANGLIQDPVSGKWYFVSAGQVASNYRGLALYDGQWFYVWDGVFQSDAEGWVEHDGAMFYVVNGMVTGN